MTNKNLKESAAALPSIAFMTHSPWSFHNPVRLTVGRGCRAGLIKPLKGKSVLIVTTIRGRMQWTADILLAPVLEHSQVHWVDSITENPRLDRLQSEIDRLKGVHIDAVVGFGGGSAMDAAKILNVALHPACRQYSLTKLIAEPSLHSQLKPSLLYTVSTTSGTGSEVTPFATVWDHQNKTKLSLTGDSVFPHTAYVDAELTDTLPLEVTISTGLDAINQAAESVWNKNANIISLSYAARALQLGFQALPKLATNKGGPKERDQMAEASVLAGLAISHTRTALCHSISYPMTAHYGVPHGLACAFSMPAVLRYNLHAEDGRFTWLAQALTGSEQHTVLVELFEKLHTTLDVPGRIRYYIPELTDLLALQDEMIAPERADNNLRKVNNLTELLYQAWSA